MRSLIPLVMVGVALSGCSTFTGFGDPPPRYEAAPTMVRPDPGGVPLGEASTAVDTLERCSKIERVDCRVDGSGFRGATSPAGGYTPPAYAPQTNAAPPVSQAPVQEYAPASYGYARPTVVLPPYGSYQQYYGYGYNPYRYRGLYGFGSRYRYRNPFYGSYGLGYPSYGFGDYGGYGYPSFSLRFGGRFR